MKEQKKDTEKDLEQTILGSNDAPQIPEGFTSAKEVEQADQIRQLQQQLAGVSEVLAKVGKRIGVTPQSETKSADYFGFIRALEGDAILEWATVPGSYVKLNQFDQIEDNQYMTVKTLSGKTEKMHYTEFDQRTKVNQIPVKILDYCTQNQRGEWRPRHFKPTDEHTVVLSEDNGKTYEGKRLQIKHCFLN